MNTVTLIDNILAYKSNPQYAGTIAGIFLTDFSSQYTIFHPENYIKYKYVQWVSIKNQDAIAAKRITRATLNVTRHNALSYLDQ